MKRRLCKISYKDIEKHINNGFTSGEVGKIYGFKANTIYYYAKRLGLNFPRGTNNKDRNGQWKGKNASISAFHIWINNNHPKPNKCENCGKESKLHLSNIKNHNYSRNIKDYKYLCVSCHHKLDKKINNIKHMNNKKIWTKMDIDYLKDKLGDNVNDLSKKLNRTRKAVWKKIWEIKEGKA